MPDEITNKPEKQYSLVTDPIYYVTIALFALLTTALPAGLGQPRFLPIIQSLSLTVFAGIAIRQQRIPQAIRVFAIWLSIQIIVMAAMSALLGTQTDAAIRLGFDYRSDLTAWLYTELPYPRGLIADPAGRIIEVAGVVLGSLVSGGLIGNWFLVRAANLTGFSIGTLLVASDPTFTVPLRIPLWSIFQITGYAGIVILFSQPVFNNQWLPSYYWRHQHRLVIMSTLFLIIGFLLELFIAPIWKFTP